MNDFRFWHLVDSRNKIIGERPCFKTTIFTINKFFIQGAPTPQAKAPKTWPSAIKGLSIVPSRGS